MQPVFIGGTGRSGTTILARMLSLHKDIFTIPFETRFIVDPYGLADLVDALSEKWSLYNGDRALRDFKNLMETLYPTQAEYLLKMALFKLLPKIGISPPKYVQTISKPWIQRKYPPFSPPIKNILTRNQYFLILENFYNQITLQEYRGYWVGSGVMGHPSIIITKKYNKEEVMKLAYEFICEFIRPVLKRVNSQIWVDHTPTNIGRVLFLNDLVPTMKFIHIYRDPRDVVSSYKTKTWGGNSVSNAANIIDQTLRKWEQDKQLLSDNTYIEISLEDLVSNTYETAKHLHEFLSIDFQENTFILDLKKSHSGRWKNDLSREELKTVEKKLYWFMCSHGYSGETSG